jgi:PAS domain S-box-containing protein
VQQRTLELQTERDRTQAILEALGEAVIVTDKSGIIQYINPAATRLRGLGIEEAVGKPWRFWHGSHHSNEQYQQIQASIHAGKTWRGEVTQNHRNGAVFDVAMTVAPLFDPHMPDTSIGAVSVQRDVTPLKEAERMKDQFVSNVSHELRTPLSIITLLSGNLDTLHDRLDHAKRRKMIRDIREHAQVLNDLISSVLEISRIDGRRVSSEHEPLNLVNIVREEVERQMPLAQKKQQTLHLLGPALLPIQGNDSQIRQVIRNILNNAIKYTPNGGSITCEFQGSREAPTAHLDADADIEPSSAALWSLLPEDSTDIWPGMHCLDVTEAWAALRIIDTGIGISSEDLPHIFERFYRVQSQGNIPGTGLGLSIAQELVGLHEGKLAVASRPGKGSIVAIYLPLAEEDI